MKICHNANSGWFRQWEKLLTPRTISAGLGKAQLKHYLSAENPAYPKAIIKIQLLKTNNQKSIIE